MSSIDTLADPAASAPSSGARESLLADKGSYTAWLAFQCESISGVLSGVLVLGVADTGPFVPQAFWPGHHGGAPRLAEVAEQALTERRPVMAVLAPHPDQRHRAGSLHGLALPIEMDGHLFGVVSIEVDDRPAAGLQLALQQLRWGCAWIEAQFRLHAKAESTGIEGRLMAVLDLVASVLEEERFEPACRSLVTELATRLQCDRVAIGVVRKGHAALIALSHSAQLGKRMNLSHALGAAMDEAIDQKAVIRYPATAEDEIVVVRDHERLALDHGSGSVLTVPIVGADPESGETFTGALTFERPAAMPFERADLELCQSAAAAVGRILEIKQRNERSLAAHALDSAGLQMRRLFGPRYVKRKVALVLLAAAVAFFSIADADYRVTAPSTLEGAVRRAMAAPFDGFIATAPARAGDVVQTGAVLATLDDRDLRLERLKWASQYGQYLRQHQEAVANRERAKAQIVQALYEQAQAQVNLLDEQISRAAIRAPFSGVIVKGDLSQSLGSAVKRGDVLFEITPLESYRVIVDVDEREIADVASGQKGNLVLASISNEAFPFTVLTVTSVTTAREGRNYFRVEGLMDIANERLRPGMEGVGKIDIERRRLIWIWTHRLVNWARLFAWTHLP